MIGDKKSDVSAEGRGNLEILSIDNRMTQVYSKTNGAQLVLF